MVMDESDEGAGDGHGALHLLSAAEHYAKRLNRTCLYDCTIVRNVQSPFEDEVLSDT